MNKLLSQFMNIKIDKITTRDYFLILLGSILQAIALRGFLIPAKLASGGVSGLSQIINNFTGWPIGVMVLLGNIPLFVLGWRFLGGPRFAARTVFAVISFSILIDIPLSFFPLRALQVILYLIHSMAV